MWWKKMSSAKLRLTLFTLWYGPPIFFTQSHSTPAPPSHTLKEKADTPHSLFSIPATSGSQSRIKLGSGRLDYNIDDY